MKNASLILICIAIAFLVFSSNSGEEKIADPVIGKTVTLNSALLIVTNSGYSDSPTAIKINRIGMDIGSIIGCAGCHHESEKLIKVLTKGQQVTITDAYNNVRFFSIWWQHD